MTRRHFFGLNSTGVGLAALAGLLGRDLRAAAHGGLPGLPHFPPTAKRVIYLFQSGGPSQMELFDYKPRLSEFQGTDLPESDSRRPAAHRHVGDAIQLPGGALEIRVRAARPIGRVGQRTAAAHREDRRPADVRQDRVNTEEINHDPAVTMVQTGFRLGGRPSMGAWVSYGSAARPRICRRSA